MDLDLNPAPPTLGSICEGCLSVDRKLTTQLEDDSRKFFTEILDPLEHVGHPLSLCWECTALLKRITKFKMQVRNAHDWLVKYVLHQSAYLPKLSQLSQTSPKLENHPKTGNQYQNFQPGKSNTSDQPGNSNKSDQPGNSNINEIQSLFVKKEVEDFEDLRSNVDNCLDKGSETDGTHIKAAVKPDPFPYEVPISNETKTESKNGEKKVEFNESDDEPLTLKKHKETEDKECKPRRRRKKDESGPKIDRRTLPKQEKPAGVVSNPRVNRRLQKLNMNSEQLEMVVLSWEEVELERQKALASETFTRHSYRCYDCALGFNHKFKLTNHMKKHDPAAGDLWCSLCGVRCRDKPALAGHRRRHRVRWRCCACGAAWSTASVAAEHVAREHGAAPPVHVCTTCGHTATTLSKFRNHMKDHAERIKCELCDKTLKDRNSLRTHLFIHRGEKEHSCPTCDKKFLFKKGLEEHMTIHGESAQLYCHQCDMNFKNKVTYYQHMTYNLKHIDPAKLKYACQLCDKRFVKPTRLEEHNMAVHLKETPIKCTVEGCALAFSSRPVLRTHIRLVHRNGPAARNHVCHTCGKAYTAKKILAGHMRTHTGERPFHCTHCPATFGYEAALYNHNKLVHLKPKTGRNRAARQAPPASAPAAAPAPAPV